MRRELIAAVGDKEHEISVDRKKGRFFLRVGGAAREVDAVQVSSHTWSLLMDGRSFLIHLDRGSAANQASRLRVMSAPNITPVEIEDARRRRLAQVAGGSSAKKGEQLRAPIAGKVVQVDASIGDKIAPGQGVLVLEAMKMENEITSERGGTIKEIHVKAGQSVDSGDLLATISA